MSHPLSWLAALGCQRPEGDGSDRPEPALTVTVAPGRLANDLELGVVTSEAAPVAALCTGEDDPTERHLVESTAAATSHALRFQGLRPDTTYTCAVAATDPAGRATEITASTGPSPEFPVLATEVDPQLGATGHYTLLSYMDGACTYGERWLLLYDAAGAVRWWYALPDTLWIDVEALYDPTDRTVVWGGGDSTSGRARIVDLWAGDTYVSDFAGWDTLVYSHDAKRRPDGQLLTLDYRETTDGVETWLGFGMKLHDPVTRTVSWDLSSQRYFDEGWLPSGGGADDPYHANWFEYVTDPTLGDRLYLSLCTDQSLMSFDVATGDVRWKLGRGLGWTVVDAEGQPLSEDELPQCQHGNEVLAPDLLLVYDNGQQRSESRIERWRIDPQAHVATREWLWTEPGWHEGTLGDVDLLANGRLLVTQAHPECWSESPGDLSEVVEVDPATGQVAGRMAFPDVRDTLYRAERYDGCAMLSSLAACPALAQRAEDLAPLVGW
ncbi:MAG: aryl-sulfate sulfotransferase [Myxococcota bacterium]